MSSEKKSNTSKAVDIVHLASNIDKYQSWDGNSWRAFKAMALPDDASFEECQEAVFHCIATGLNPLRREIFFIRRKGKIVPQTAITGFHKLAHDTKMYCGMTPVMWCGKDKVWTEVWDPDDGVPLAAKVGAYHRNFTEPFYCVAIFAEYLPEESKARFMWNRMGAHMIGKCVKALCLRELFPGALSGLYTDDEMAQAGPPDKVTTQSIKVEEPKSSAQPKSAEKSKSKPKAKTKEQKQKRVAYLMSIAGKKWPDLKGDDLNAELRSFAEERDLLALHPEEKRASIRLSSDEQIEATIKELNNWQPPEPDEEIQEADFVPSGDLLLEKIEEYEAHLSQIPDPDDRDEWLRAEVARAITLAPKKFKAVPLNQVYGQVDEQGLPVSNDWTEEQLKRWLIHLEGQMVEEVPL